MAAVIPTDAAVAGVTTGQTTAINNIADVLGLLTAILAQGGGPAAVRETPPAGNASGITALQTMLGWAGKGIGSGYFPWQFPVEAYGALGNGKVITDATMVSGSNLLNSPAQAQFVNATVALGGDIGKSVLCSCAGGGTYSPLGSTTSAACTITAVNSATQAVLSVNASSTTPGASIAAYASDDSTAINAAKAAAIAYAQANNGYAEVIFSNSMYGLAGTYNPVNYQSALGNSLIPLPVIAGTVQKILLVFTGPTKTQDQALIHWYQTVPQVASSVLLCLRTDGTNNGTYGPSSVVGSPYDGYWGQGLNGFTNIMPVVDGVQIVVPYNSTYGGWDLMSCAEAVVPNGSAMPLAVVNYGATGGPPYPNMYLNASGNISNQWTWGLRMPQTGNNDRCDVFSWSCEGLCYGIGPSEHGFVAVTRDCYCVIGIEGYAGGGQTMPHAGLVEYASVESVGGSAAVGFFDGSVNLDIQMLDTESVAPMVYDPSNRGIGSVGLRFGPSIGYQTGTTVVNGGAYVGLKSLDNIQLHGVISSGVNGYPAVPTSGVAQVNGFYRDCTVYITSTAAITNVKVNGTTVNGLTTAGAGTVAIPVPSGLTYTVTTTGTVTMQWVAT